jgi:hypothetical protein
MVVVRGDTEATLSDAAAVIKIFRARDCESTAGVKSTSCEVCEIARTDAARGCAIYECWRLRAKPPG